MELSGVRIQLAMTTDWWVTRRDWPASRSAIVDAFHHHWLLVVEGPIRQIRCAGRQPSTWEQSSAMDRNFSTR